MPVATPKRRPSPVLWTASSMAFERRRDGMWFVVCRVRMRYRLNRVVQCFDVMDVADVSLHVGAAGSDIVGFELSFGACSVEMLGQATVQRGRKELPHGLEFAGLEGFVSRGDGSTRISASGLQSHVRRSLAGAMDAHECFEEIPIR